ncbi:hypothetical protein N7532_002691 [Penicillium argentinense]|uniref:Uncharacterized protein n=1 Tax=Penicillium argentinense TaxID=1131581 RepID=A0A9W9G117_9EURO|nr:uncharacterized protein N7532_002691 [Penicillium argentinense]KAJ5110046.1 hypothetical protein N7532_002691 [Penicillium argentinense]
MTRALPVRKTLPHILLNITHSDYCSEILLWASAETGLTILAASIPSLRILFRRMRSSYDQTEDPSRNYVSDEPRSKIKTAYKQDPYFYYAGELTTLLGREDNNSEEIILTKMGGIKQTQAISVRYKRDICDEQNEMQMGAVSPGRTL